MNETERLDRRLEKFMSEKDATIDAASQRLLFQLLLKQVDSIEERLKDCRRIASMLERAYG